MASMQTLSESQAYTLFDTTIGPCGIAWSERAVTRLQLPGPNPRATEQRLRAAGAHSPGVPPPDIERIVANVQLYLSGQKIDFSSIALDLAGVSPFHQTIYRAARAVPWGHTATYGDLAHQIGAPDGARAVGQALGRNPVPIIIPCHRILAKGDKLRGFSAYGGIVTKERLLVLENLRLI
jgi:methylated-DNA-[protein]-cysteine S-methyltransferase